MNAYEEWLRVSRKETDYYRGLVRDVCNLLDHFYKTKTNIGTPIKPSDELYERVKEQLYLRP